MSLTVWFWQRMITPHMFHLARALALRGHDVVYVAEEPMSSERAAMGWSVPDLDRSITLHMAPNNDTAREIARIAPRHSIHLTQGLRANGVVSAAQNEIRNRKLRHFAIMETVDLRGLKGRIKPAIYAWSLWQSRRDLEGVLAIGADTPAWLEQLAPSKLRIHPFAYFLPEPPPLTEDKANIASTVAFRFLFVGSLIPLKRVGLLLETLGKLSDCPFTLDVIGDGPLLTEVQGMADRTLPGQVRFHGILPITEVAQWMASADCLVLPSSHDGWGAVVSEAILAGTPVVCSSACGSKALVNNSPRGLVFRKDRPQELEQALRKQLAAGPISPPEREALHVWGRCAGSVAGAEYLEKVLQEPVGEDVLPPWQAIGRYDHALAEERH